jgi:hypothetical protein
MLCGITSVVQITDYNLLGFVALLAVVQYANYNLPGFVALLVWFRLQIIHKT